MPRLTQSRVDRIEPDPARRITVWDDVLKGFGVRVAPNGRNTFVVRYRPRATRRFKWFTLGRTSVLSAAEARRRAGAALALVAAGEDPSEQKAPRAAPAPDAEHRGRCMTLAEFAPIYMRDHARKEKKRRSADGDQSNLDRFLLPAFGERHMDEITPVEIAKLQARIGEATPVQANRVVALISVLYSKAVDWRILSKEHELPESMAVMMARKTWRR